MAILTTPAAGVPRFGPLIGVLVTPQIKVVQNWFEELRRLVPTN